MTKQTINVGTSPNDNRGDSLRASFQKINANFTELYTALGLDTAPLNLGAFEFTGSVLSTTDSSAIVIDQATTITSNLTVGGDVLPSVANGGDLGSSARPWKSLYVSSSTIYIGTTSLSVDSQGNLLVGGQAVADVGTAAWNSITGKPTFATVATSGAYYDLIGRPTSFNSLVTGAYSVNLESGGVLRANVQGIVSDNQLAVEGSTLISIQTLDGPYLQLFNQGATKEINLVLYDGESLNPTWTFDTDRTLTLPNDSSIKSATNIDITVDTPDSSTFNWRFGADGELTLPEDAVVKTISGNLTVQGQSYVFIDSATNGQINIGTSSGVGAVVLGSKSRGTNVVVDDLVVANGVYEYFSSLADATGVVTHNCANGHLFYHTSPDANWTVNLTNLLDIWNRATSVTLIIAQGATGYIPSAVQIAGVAQTIKWQGNVTPTPSTNRTDVVTFSIINVSGTYTVLGQLTGF